MGGSRGGWHGATRPSSGRRAVLAWPALALASTIAPPPPGPALLPAPAPAAAQERSPVDVEAGASREVLSGDRDPWEDYWIRATIRPGPGTHVYGGVRYTRRFGEDDQQFEAGGGLPLAERWSLRVDGTWSPTHLVLPIWGASGTVVHRLDPDWSLYAGGGRQEWDPTGVSRQHAGVDRHFESFRIGYRLGFHQIDTGGSGVRHGLSGSWLYGGGSNVTLGLGAGRAAAIVGPRDVRSVDARSATISGVHWLDERTGIGYNFGLHRHGDFFTRTRSSVGIRRRL